MQRAALDTAPDGGGGGATRNDGKASKRLRRL